MLPKLLNSLDGSHAIALAHDVSNEPRDEAGRWTTEHTSQFDTVVEHAKNVFTHEDVVKMAKAMLGVE